MTISATIIADSVSIGGARITTLQLRYPRFIHAEFMTHRVFSRNASSSRAIPVDRLISDTLNDPVSPSYWGANRKGMQATEEVADPEYCQRMWDAARDLAITAAVNLKNAGAHKQIVNRLLEPFSHINVVVTATEWDNFFNLRCHPDAQPEIQELANRMKECLEAKPKEQEWHLPYVQSAELHRYPVNVLVKLSTARCARVSYLTHDERKPLLTEDLALYERLTYAQPPHLSPLEHAARSAEPEYMYANFAGWISHRTEWERGSAVG